MNIEKPLLSIWIPTYNRAHLLEDSLRCLGPQIAEQEGKVEVVVSDNASSDHTEEVGRRMAEQWGIRYFRNERNLGVAPNFDAAVRRCRGEFVWGLGDDDLVAVGGVRDVVRALEQNSDVDFVFINSRSRGMACRLALGRPVCAEDFGEGPPFVSVDKEDRRIDDWQELLEPSLGIDLFVGFYTGAIRRCLWLQVSDEEDFAVPFCHSLPSTYPHCVVYGKSMVGRPAFHLARPVSVSFNLHQSWRGYSCVIFLQWVFALLDMYEAAGVDPKRIERCRRAQLRKVGRSYFAWMFRKGLPGRQLFDGFRFFRRHALYPQFWTGMTIWPLVRLFKSFSRR